MSRLLAFVQILFAFSFAAAPFAEAQLPSHMDPLYLVASQSAAGPTYTPETALFDGTDWARFTGTGVGSVPGLDSGKAFTLGAWIRCDGSNSTTLYILSITATTDARLLFFRNSENKIRFSGYDSSTVERVQLKSLTSVTSTNGWTHVLVVVNTATSLGKVYINGVDDTDTVLMTADATISMPGSRHTLSGTGGATPVNRFYGAMADLWFDDSAVDDPSKFISGGRPVSLGANGELVMGSAPVWYLKDSASDFVTSYGTGQSFTLTGTLQTTTPP